MGLSDRIDTGYPLDAGAYTPARYNLIGASFVTINGTSSDLPHTGEYLQQLASARGEVLVVDGLPGDLVSDFVTHCTTRRDIILGPNQPAGYKMDKAVLGLSGEQIQDSCDGGEYTTFPLMDQCFALMREYATKAYALRPMPFRGRDVGYLRNNTCLDDDLADLYIAEWDAHMLANNPDVGIIDCYYDWVDSKVEAPVYDPWGDWHLDTRSAYRAATRILETLTMDNTP